MTLTPELTDELIAEGMAHASASSRGVVISARLAV
jgi:hypothetical protein